MKQWIGKTVLFRVLAARLEDTVQFGAVNGLSKSGKYVLIGSNWYDVEKVQVLEELLGPKANGTNSASAGTSAGTPAPAAPAKAETPAPAAPAVKAD
jgi:hypothetical protein